MNFLKIFGTLTLGGSALGLLLLLGVWALAVWWTYDPPQLPLFTDPITGQTGLFAGKE